MINRIYLPIRVILLSFFLCASAAANGRVETIRFQSKLIETTLPYNVILPTDYDNSRTTRYPVLYLLHGLTGHFSDWVTRTNIANYAGAYRMIVITPEGNDSWYVDKYESYILQELIPDVQKRYRTIEAPSRAVDRRAFNGRLRRDQVWLEIAGSVCSRRFDERGFLRDTPQRRADA